MSKNIKFSLNALVLLLFPFSITSIPSIHGVIISMIVFMAAIFYFRGYGRQFEVTQHERKLYFVVILMVVVALFVTLIATADLSSLKNITKILLLLMAVPVYFYFRAVGISYKWFWYGLIAGSILSAVVAVYEITFDVYKPGAAYYGRAKGATHPIIFGDLALLMGFMSMAGYNWFKTRANWQIILPVIAVIAGLLASVLSQSRGGWVAIPFMVAILFWSSHKHTSHINKAIGVVVLTCAFLMAYLIPQTGMQKKVQETVNNIQGYFDSEITDRVRGSSIGSRFEMWQASWQIFVENPVLGVGWGNYQKHAKALIEKGERNWSAASYPHPHNQFLSSLVSGGIVAFVATVLLFFIPAKIFFDVVRLQGGSPDMQMIAAAGLLMVISFAIFNLSESFLERSRTVSFFIFYLAVCMAGIRDDEVGSRKSEVVSRKS